MLERVAELPGDSLSQSRAANPRKPERDCLRPRSAREVRAALLPRMRVLGQPRREGPVGAAHPNKGSWCLWQERESCRRSRRFARSRILNMDMIIFIYLLALESLHFSLNPGGKSAVPCVHVTWLRTNSLCDFFLSQGRNAFRKKQGPDNRNQVFLNMDIPFWTKKSFLYHAYFPC